MKKLLLVILGLSLMFLTGCSEDIYIEPNKISVVFENPRYEGTSFFIDVNITNGLSTDEYVGYMEFDIYSSDEELYIAGAGFDIEETILSHDYITVELEFESEFVFIDENTFNESGSNLSEVVLYFWIE
ncbi:MAG: hypothetical protein J7K80_02180 [Candidatus Izimaplasma sp.]|nr:hypothetical protein [Candidatus Izimaplasma bacterium]